LKEKNTVNQAPENASSSQNVRIMIDIKLEDLLSTGAHFGHVTRKWHPNYKPFVLMEKNGVHIINLEETIRRLNIALDFITSVVKKNGEILFIGTKKQAKDIVQQEADRCSMFYVVERWLGGTLTNFTTIKKSIKRLHALEKEGSSIYEDLTKKEVQMLNRERIKLADQHRGIKDMRRLPDAVVIVDVNFESTAVLESNRLGLPIIGIVDSNSNPDDISYPIPANDDSIRAIQLLMSTISQTIIDARGIDEEFDTQAQDAAAETTASEVKTTPKNIETPAAQVTKSKTKKPEAEAAAAETSNLKPEAATETAQVKPEVKKAE